LKLKLHFFCGISTYLDLEIFFSNKFLNYNEKNTNSFVVSYLCSVVKKTALILCTSVHAVNLPSQESIPDAKAPAVLKRIMRSPAVRLFDGLHLTDLLYLKTTLLIESNIFEFIV
jgi:hypothetical protein